MKSKAAVALGRKGGSKKSEAKTKAARENAKKGGRPVIYTDTDAVMGALTQRDVAVKQRDALMSAAAEVLESYERASTHPPQLDKPILTLRLTVELIEEFGGGSAQ